MSAQGEWAEQPTANIFGVLDIENVDLTPDQLPAPDARWGEIAHFGLSYDGYKHESASRPCADSANAARDEYREREVLPDSLDALRSCLFYEQRRYHHFGEPPDEWSLGYIHALLEAIRRRVAASSGAP